MIFYLDLFALDCSIKAQLNSWLSKSMVINRKHTIFHLNKIMSFSWTLLYYLGFKPKQNIVVFPITLPTLF